MENEELHKYRVSPTKQLRSYLDFKEADPALLRILVVIEDIKDKEDPDRIILRTRDVSRVGILKKQFKKEDGVK